MLEKHSDYDHGKAYQSRKINFVRIGFALGAGRFRILITTVTSHIVSYLMLQMYTIPDATRLQTA
ncbi:hypothetical protein JCM10512_4500 [Bacteroides reticulotermitis JCM 10512]|uniref:Uncharacterized protein n=1 Tax=Bacteroides reticulotermitis JCM 10512 TaxID=1445607 RepID=W4UYL2_9BACE|nr:hypothetical protein JCM10512_4500 [Bacteroides reticulotermitis JCM 10512]